MTWSKIRGARQKHAKHLEGGRTRWTDGSDAALVDRVLAHLASTSPPPVSEELDVLAAALVGPRYWFEYNKGDKSRWPDWIERWVEHDIAFAVRALFACATREVDDSSDAIFLAPSTVVDGLGRIGPLPLTRLRDAVRAADARAYGRAKAAAAELLTRAPAAVRFALAYVFPKEGFAKDDARWGLGADADPEDHTTAVLYALAMAGDARCTAEATESESCWDGWVALERGSKALAGELGARALPIVRLILLGSTWGEAQVRDAQALVTLEATADVARVAAELLERHHAGAVVRPWLMERPAITIGAIAEHVGAASERRAKVPAATSLLSALVLAHRATAESAAPKASAAARAALERALDETKPVPDASQDELPASLARPPWRVAAGAKGKKVEASAPAYPKLDRLPYDERVAWAEGESAEGAASAAFRTGGEERSKARDATVLRSLESERRKQGYAFAFQLGGLTDAAAQRVLGEWGPDAFYYDAGDILGIVGRHGLGALDVAMRFVAAKPGSTVEGLVRVDSPRAAPLMAHVAVNLKKQKDIAEQWLTTHAEAAAIGLLPALAEHSGKERATIEEALRLVARNDPDKVRAVAKRYGAGAVAALEFVVASSAFSKLPKKLPKLPKFFQAGALPRPLLAGAKKALPLAAVSDLGVYLALGKRDIYHPALFAIRDACDRASLARFAWALFSEWMGAGAPTKDDFGFFVLGIFGDDAAARALQPMIKAWAPGGFPTRAQMGVDVLAALGTHAALEEVYKTATKVRSRALAAHAEATLQKIAARLKLSREDLADRLVPDLDLDERGARVFDYGKRKFTVRVGEHFKLYVDMGGGKRLEDLPKPGSGDDEEAAGAWASFKEMKKRAREVVSEQSKRLEHALVSRRKYDAKTFDERFVDHALLRMFGARLVWGAYVAGGGGSGGDGVASATLRGAFRIDDGDFLDVVGKRFELRAGESVGLVHPAELDAGARARWSDVLAELRIIQPIVQLGREVFAPSEAAVVDALSTKVPTGKVMGLERRFWRRGASGQGGVVSHYEKAVGERGRAVLALYPGVSLGDPKEDPEQALELALFAGPGGTQPMRLGDLDPAVASELLADLASLTAT